MSHMFFSLCCVFFVEEKKNILLLFFFHSVQAKDLMGKSIRFFSFIVFFSESSLSSFPYFPIFFAVGHSHFQLNEAN